MATGNVNLTTTLSDITVTQTPSNITVTDLETNNNITLTTNQTDVAVTSTSSNVTVTDFAQLSNSSIRQAISVDDAGYDIGSLTYSNITGVLTFVGVENSDVRSLISATSPVTYNSSTGEIGFEQTLSNLTLQQWQETVVDNGSVSGNVSFDMTQGTIHTANLVGNITNITFANISEGGSATVLLEQDVIGNHILDDTYLTNWNWVGDYKTLDSAPSNTTMISVVFDGTDYQASLTRFDSFSFDDAIRDYTGNIENLTGNVTTTANIQAAYFIGDGSELTNVGGLDQFSVTTNTASGNGALSYNNTSGVFSFTPADTSLATKTTDDLTEGSTNLYFNGKTTDDLTEGSTNLYYDSGLAISDARTGLSVLQNTASGNGTLSYTSIIGRFEYTPPDLSGFGNSNLTNAQVQTYIQDNGLNGSGNITTTGVVTFGNSATQTHNFTGNINVTGNIEVDGNLNYRNVEDLYVQDQSITLNANAATDATVSIIANRPVAGANTVLRWNETSDIWEFTNDGSTYYPIPTSTSDLAEGTNQYFTTDRANSAILNYNGDITRMNQANISRISVGGANVNLDSGLLTFPDLQFYSESSGERYFIGAQLSAGTTNGVTDAYVKSRGNISAPAVINSNDIIKTSSYYAHDGTNWMTTFGEHIYQDSATSGVSSNIIPLGYEIYTQQDGDINANSGFPNSLVKFRSDRTIAFNDTNTRHFGTGAGNANIQMDGTINTVSGINATGTITGGNLTIASIAYPSADGTNGQVITTDGNGVLTFGDIPSQYGDANVDAHLNTATATTGQVLSWDGADYDWITNAGGYSNTDVQNFLENGYSAANINANDIVAVTFSGEGSDLTDVRAESMEVTLKNADTVTIPKGYPVHATGFSGSGEVEVVLADAGNAELMPAHFIAGEELTSVGDTGRGILGGRIQNIDTSSFTVGDTIFVAVGGGYANVAPSTEANLIQNLGIVTRIDASSGGGEIMGAGRTAATPNLNDGKIFLGNADNKSATVTLDTNIVPENGNLYFTTDRANSAILNYTGDLTQYNQANISRLSVGHDNIGLDNGFNNLADFQTYAQGTGFSDSFIAMHQYNGDTSLGQRVLYVKGRGTVASPANAQSRDRVVEFDYYGHNPGGSGFTTYIDGAGHHVYHDDTPTTDVVPMAHEWWVQLNGSGGEDSVLALRSDRTITFNANELRGDPSTGNGGNANITQDGTINTVANINATGNISGTNFIGDVVGNVTGTVSTLSNFTSDDLTQGSTNQYWLGTSTNSTTGNLDLNSSSTDGDGLYGLLWDSSANKFISSPDSATKSPDHFITIEKDSTDLNLIRSRVARNGAFGAVDTYEKASGSLVSPTALGNNDEIYHASFFGHDGTDYGCVNNNASMEIRVFQDTQTASVSTNIVPTCYEISGYLDGNLIGFPTSFMSIHSDGKVVFNDAGTRGFNSKTGTANISRDGSIVSATNIEARGSMIATDFNGSGATLSDINSFGTIDVSGQTSVIAGNTSSNLTLAASGAIEITTDAANGTVTIGGTGGTYGNSDVENFMSSGAYEANLEMIGNVNINPNTANVVTASGNISSYFGNVNTGSNDQFQMSGTGSDPDWADGTAITFGNTTNPDLTFLNGNVYYTKDIDGAGTVYEIYTDSGLTTPLQSGLGSESPTGLTAEYVESTDVDLEITGDLKSSNALFTNSIQSYTDGGTIQCQSLRVEDFSVTQPFGINVVANSSLNSGAYVNPFQGSLVHVTGDRYGADGAPAYWNGNNWKYISDDANVTI